MHELEPYHRWQKYYDAAADKRSPFYGKQYNYDVYSETVYNYYVDPAWDSIGSESLFVKILYADYDQGYGVIQFLGEWNDAIHNDIMILKRNILEVMMANGIHKFILLGENIMNFHGSDDSYYEEWFEEVEEGWIAAVAFPEFVQDEFRRYRLDQYINMGGTLQLDHWRTLQPRAFCQLVEGLIQRRLH